MASKKKKRTQSASSEWLKYSAHTLPFSLLPLLSYPSVVCMHSAGMRKNACSSPAVGVDGKDIASLRDGLVELKKSLNSVTRERDLLHTKCAKLEQALGKKDKEIEDLLASGHITVRSEYYMYSLCCVHTRHVAMDTCMLVHTCMYI